MGLSGAEANVRVGVRAAVVVAVAVEHACVRGVVIVAAGVEQALYPHSLNILSLCALYPSTQHAPDFFCLLRPIFIFLER